MDISELRNLVENQYNVQALTIEKVKNVYKIKTAEGDYCLKVIKYVFEHFYFILSAIKHLQKSGFETVPEIIKTKQGLNYIEFENKFAYLTLWINARECNYDNPLDVRQAAIKLGELHNLSCGFEVTKEMKPRVGWLKWVETFETRRKEVLDFKVRINKKSVKSEFDEIYLSVMEDELKRAHRSINHLCESSYFLTMEKEMALKGFCHHDYAHHNVLITNGGSINIIDFDYCILDSHLHDLSSLLLRRMKNGKWDMENALEIINAYSKVREIKPEEVPIMAAFMEFPQDYWQVGIQYYWESQPWGEDFFVKKLKKICEDREEKQDFIDEFKSCKFEA